jgi:hypothetical protein
MRSIIYWVRCILVKMRLIRPTPFPQAPKTFKASEQFPLDEYIESDGYWPGWPRTPPPPEWVESNNARKRRAFEEWLAYDEYCDKFGYPGPFDFGDKP